MWILFPILAAVAYAISAFLKNYLTDNALPKKKAGAYLITQLLSFGLAMLVLYAMLGRGIFMAPLGKVIGLTLAGMVDVLGMVFYYKALGKGETMEVTIFGQSAPLIALALGVVFLGETVTATQGLAFVLIMSAAGILIFGAKNKKSRDVNIATAGLAFVSAIFWVGADVIFVGAGGENASSLQNFGQNFFFFEMGALLATLIVTVSMPSWRRAVKNAFFGEKKGKNLIAAAVDTGFFTAAEFLFKIGLTMAPAVALISVVAHVAQLGVTFILGIFLSRAFPRVVKEKYDKRLILQHFVAAILVVTGVIMLG